MPCPRQAWRRVHRKPDGRNGPTRSARTRIRSMQLRSQLMVQGPLSDDQVRQYHERGFVLARAMFDAEEIELLGRAAREDRELDRHAFQRRDGEGGQVRLSLWNHPGQGIYGAFARCASLVESAEKLLGGEVYHYHSKMIMKDPKIGGAWA